jgi:hypothetical protein
MDEFSKEFNDKIKASYEAGFTPEQIMAHLEESKHPEGAKWTEKMKMLENASDVTPMSTKNNKSVTNEINALPWWAIPAAIGTVGGLATGATILKGKSSIDSRNINKTQPSVDTGIEIATPEQMSRFQSHPVFKENPSIVTQEQFDLQQKGLANRAANQANFKPLSDLPTNPVAPQDQILKAVDPLQAIKDKQAMARLQAQQSMQQSQTPQAVAKQQAPQAPIPPTVSPEEAPVIASVSNAAQDKTELKGAVKPNLTTGSGMPAIQGTAPPEAKFKSNFEGPHQLPSTHAFVPNGQYMDTVRNGVGQEAYTASLKNAGGFPATVKEADALSRQINESMGRMPRDVAKDLNIGLGEGTKGITRSVAGKKLVQMAGIPGAIIAMADLAKAGQESKNKSDIGPILQSIFNLAQNAGVQAGFALRTGGLNTNEERELAMRRKMGGGRGVAPAGMGQQ